VDLKLDAEAMAALEAASAPEPALHESVVA